MKRLVLGDVDLALEMLEKSSALDSSNAAILNDLAVAYLERAARQKRALDVVEAFERADHALRLDPTSPPAAFNRALAIERLGLRTEAVSAWRSVPESSEWTREAAEHIAHLSAPTQRALWEQVVDRFESAAASNDIDAVLTIVEDYPQQARVHFEERLCGRWAAAVSDGRRSDAERILRSLRSIAGALRTATGNELPIRTVTTIDDATHDPVRSSLLIRGHLIYQRAIEAYRDVAITKAEPDFIQSERLLGQARSPFALLPLFYRASSRSYQNDITECLRLLDATERRLTEAGLGTSPVLGHVLWVRGRSLLKRGFPHASLECFRRALHLFAPTNEHESLAALQDLLAHNYQFVGEDDRAWSHYIAAMNLVEEAGARRRERVILHGLAGHLASRGRPRTALLYISALIRLATEDRDAGDHARALLNRSRAHHILGNAAAADDDLRQARTFAAQVSDAGMRDELDADLSAAEADAGTAASAKETLRRFDHAIDVARRVEKETLLPRLWTARARVSRSFDPSEAERSLLEAIAVIERHRWALNDRDLQISFAEQWYAAFDDMIDLLVEQGRHAEALWFAERSRRRALFAELHSERPALDAESLATSLRRIPDGHVLIQYALLDRSTVLWIVRRDGISCRRLPIGRMDLELRLGELRTAIATQISDDAVRPMLAELYDLIFRPAEPELRAGERLIVVPDKALHGLPFGALYDARRKRWLIEDRPVGIAPSLRLFVAALQRDEELIPRRDTLLVIGDPAFDRNRFPDLDRLPAARAEAVRIARFYADAQSLVASEATVARFLHEVRGRSIVHIATHALPNRRMPSWSALLFAAGSTGADTGILYAFQIEREAFRETRLVVLAGCETALGKETRYEGTLSLARSFMTAGVPNVVSTLWRIDDAASKDLLLTFHQRLRTGDDPLAALRHAQLGFIGNPDPNERRIASWAGFQLIGGSFPARSL